MGAFFLFEKNPAVDLIEAERSFQDQGFAAKEVFSLGTRELWLYRKQLTTCQNYSFGPRNARIFAVGTLAYRGLDYRESLEKLVADHEKNGIEFDRLLGVFFIIINEGNRILFVRDRQRIHEVFSSPNGSVVSSSFLSVVASSRSPLNINKKGLMENLLCGYPLRPKTIVDGVSSIESDLEERWRPEGERFHRWPKPKYESHLDGEYAEVVETQLKVCRDVISSFKPMATSFGSNIGVSGGVDSRLLILLATRAGIDVNAHTHRKPLDPLDREIAERVCSALNVRLTTTFGGYPEDSDPAQVAESVIDALRLFDGRIHSMTGVFNRTFTREYRAEVYEGDGFGIGGFGGEVFRNFDGSSFSPARFGDWVQYRVFSPHLLHAVTDKEGKEELIAGVTSAIGKKLDIDVALSLSLHARRRYFVEVWLQECFGLRSSTENKMTFYLAPFTLASVTQSALSAVRYQRRRGGIERSMIRALHEGVAAIPYRDDVLERALPWTKRAAKQLWSRCPDSLKTRIAPLAEMRTVAPEHSHGADMLLTHAIARQGLETLRALALPLNWSRVLYSRSSAERAIGLGIALRSLGGHLRW